MIDWPETRLRLQLWLHQTMPFRVLAWLRLLGVPKGKAFGRFGGNAEMDAIVKQAATSDKYEFDNVCKTAGNAWRPVPKLTPEQIAFYGGMSKCELLTLDATLAAAKERERVARLGDSEFEPLTPEQYAVLANAEPRERGKVIDSLLPADDLEEVKRFAALGGAGPEIEATMDESEDSSQLSALQNAVQEGLADSEAGKYTVVKSAEALAAHLKSLRSSREQ